MSQGISPSTTCATPFILPAFFIYLNRNRGFTMQSLRLQQSRTTQQSATACGHAQPIKTSGFRRASSKFSGVQAGGSTLVAPCSGPLPFSSLSAGRRSLRAGRSVAPIVCQAAREPMTIAITGVCWACVARRGCAFLLQHLRPCARNVSRICPSKCVAIYRATLTRWTPARSLSAECCEYGVTVGRSSRSAPNRTPILMNVQCGVAIPDRPRPTCVVPTPAPPDQAPPASWAAAWQPSWLLRATRCGHTCRFVGRCRHAACMVQQGTSAV